MTVPPWRNWAGNQRCEPRAVASPRSVDEVAQTVAAAAQRGRRVKPVGAGHSFTGIALTDGVQLRLDALTGLRALDPGTGRVTVGAGTRLSELNRLLAEHGLALANLGDIDTQTVAGALATGTHGTGARLGGLAAQVCAITL